MPRPYFLETSTAFLFFMDSRSHVWVAATYRRVKSKVLITDVSYMDELSWAKMARNDCHSAELVRGKASHLIWYISNIKCIHKEKIVFERAISREKNAMGCPYHFQHGMSTGSPPELRVSWKPLVEIRTVRTWRKSCAKMVSDFFFLNDFHKPKTKTNQNPNWLNCGRFRVNN